MSDLCRSDLTLFESILNKQVQSYSFFIIFTTKTLDKGPFMY